MDGRFAGKVVFVTGAGGGIGAAVANRLAAEGAHVALADLNPAAVEQVAGAIVAAGGRASAHAVDVTNGEQIAQCLDSVERVAGQVTMAATCAGIIKVYPFLELPRADWDRTLAVNLTGTFLVFQETARRLVATQQKGRLVAIASVAGRSGRPNTVDYAASKAGVISLVRSTALALAPHGINVNAVCPGVVDTEMTRGIHRSRAALQGITPEQSLSNMAKTIPLGRIQTVADVAAVAAFLFCDDAGYLTGQSINACGGLEMD